MNITIPYEDYVQLKADATDRENVVSLLKAEFPDDTCQIIALKSVLKIVDEVDEPTTDPTDPSDPPSDPSTDPTDPPTP